MHETTVANMPTAALWIVAAAQIVFAFSTLLIAVAAISLLGALRKLLVELTEVVGEAKGKIPSLIDSFERRQN